MNDDILERYIIQHIEASTEENIFFSWHGGEPLMAGIDFFRRVVGFQKKNRRPGRTILNGVQTNGTLIDMNMASFFAEESFVVGISIDGPGDLHNWLRISPDGNSTLQKTLKGYEMLSRFGRKNE
jgi:uncharacterized protein